MQAFKFSRDFNWEILTFFEVIRWRPLIIEFISFPDICEIKLTKLI